MTAVGRQKIMILANKNALNRQKAVDYFKRQIECVKVVGGDYLIVVPSAVGKFRAMGVDTTEDWKWAVESVCKLTETAANNQVTLVIEPLNRYESCIVNTAEDVSRFVKEVDHPNVRALLDTYHMNIEEVRHREGLSHRAATAWKLSILQIVIDALSVEGISISGRLYPA